MINTESRVTNLIYIRVGDLSWPYKGNNHVRPGNDFFFLVGRYQVIDLIDCSNPLSGLSLRAGSRGFSPATKRVAPGYFYWKIEEK